MKLWIVVNEYLRNKKFLEHENKFSQAADQLGIEHEIVTNADCIICCNESGMTTGKIPNNIDPVLFWDKDIRLGKALEKNGHRLFNCIDSIQLCDDKSLTALALSGLNLAMPETIIAPMTYSGIEYGSIGFVDNVIEMLDFPLILKEAFGSFGAQVYKCNSRDQLMSLVKEHGDSQLIFQENIEESNGRDIRLQVVGSKVISAMIRYSVNGDFRANITNGGAMENYSPSQEQEELAIKVVEKLGLDFAGVDILFGENNLPVLCEVNSNAHFVNIDNCTGSDVAMEIIKHIASKMEDY